MRQDHHHQHHRGPAAAGPGARARRDGALRRRHEDRCAGRKARHRIRVSRLTIVPTHGRRGKLEVRGTARRASPAPSDSTGWSACLNCRRYDTPRPSTVRRREATGRHRPRPAHATALRDLPSRALTVRASTAAASHSGVLPLSGQVSEWLRGYWAILHQETSAARPAITCRARPY